MVKSIVFILFLIASGFTFGQEVCNNKIDDDHDGLVDQLDKLDCPCIIESEDLPSMIPNPSFETLDSLPNGESELSCATGWFQATNASSDLFVSAAFMKPHFPDPVDGNNFAGTITFIDYQEYLGICLPEGMLVGETYSLTFDIAATKVNSLPENCLEASIIPFDINLFGNTNCVALPLNTNACPDVSGFSPIASVTYTPTAFWTKVQMNFTVPQDINSIILGPSCNLPGNFASSCYDYFLWDNLQLKAGKDEALYYLPNAFTPDGNELNQTFEPVFSCGFDPFDYEFKIYNRWGQNVFTSNDSRIGWDGTFNGELMKEGLYSWKIRFKSPYTDETTIVSGHAALLR